jgi:hypothetical protein
MLYALAAHALLGRAFALCECDFYPGRKRVHRRAVRAALPLVHFCNTFVRYDALRVEKEGNVMAFMNMFYKHRSITVAKYGLVRDRSVVLFHNSTRLLFCSTSFSSASCTH